MAVGADVLLGLYVVLRFVYISLFQDVYGATPFDEIFAVFLLPFAFLGLSKLWGSLKGVFLWFFAYALVSVISAVVSPFSGVPQPFAAVYDVLLDAKMLVVFLSFYYILRSDKHLETTLRRLCWVLVCVALLNTPFVFRDFFFGGGSGLRGQPLLPRMGFYQPQGLLVHHIESCWTSYVGALCAIYLYLSKKSLSTAVCAFLLVLVTFMHLSTKESVAMFMCVAFLFVNRGGWAKIGFGFFMSLMIGGGLWVVTPLGDLVLGQLDSYFGDTSDSMVRTVLSIQSFQIASDMFPIGSGGGTYASPPSFQLGYSDVYIKYGISELWGATPDNPNFLVDVFWPKIIGQVGVIGLVLFMGFLWSMSRKTFDHYLLRLGHSGWLCFSICVSAFIISMAATPYSHELLFVLVGFFSAYSCVVVKRVGA